MHRGENMVATDRVRVIFADARTLYDDALEMLDQGKVRNSAEKTWGAAKRATDALVLARTGEEPGTTVITSDALDSLARQDSQVKSLVGRYYSRISQLHGQCFYNGRCASPDTDRRIRETVNYIQDAENLASVT